MAVTIKDVARVAGLSIATVSKYMNGGNVLEENRTAIDHAIQILGYRVNVIARGLKTRRTMTVGILIPTIEQVFSTEIIAAVEKRLTEADFTTIVCDCQHNEALEGRKLEILLEKQVDGIIIMPFSGSAVPIQKVLDQDVPVVLIDRKIAGLSLDCVLVDNARLAHDATSMLIDQGHRRIGIICGPSDLYTAQQRFEGYINACRDHDLPVDMNLVRFSDYEVEGGYKHFKELMALPNPPTAIFTTNYETTFAAGLAINELNIQIPEELSLVGFDGLSMARIFKPRLTIVMQPVRQIGETAAQLILDRMTGKPDLPPAREIILRGELIHGDSIASPGKQAGLSKVLDKFSTN